MEEIKNSVQSEEPFFMYCAVAVSVYRNVSSLLLAIDYAEESGKVYVSCGLLFFEYFRGAERVLMVAPVTINIVPLFIVYVTLKNIW